SPSLSLLPSFPTRRSSDLILRRVGHRHRGPVINVNAPPFPQPLRIDLGIQGLSRVARHIGEERLGQALAGLAVGAGFCGARTLRSEEHTSELQSLTNLVCR